MAGNATRGAGRGVEQHTAATRAGPQQRLVMFRRSTEDPIAGIGDRYRAALPWRDRRRPHVIMSATVLMNRVDGSGTATATIP